MSLFTQNFYDVLVGDATLAGLLATYGGAPAIFTGATVPEDAVLPYLVSVAAVADEPADTKNSTGREIVRDIACYAPATGSATAVAAIAERVRGLFHRQTFAVPGYVTEIVDASGPVAADEDDAYGRIVTVRAVLRAL